MAHFSPPPSLRPPWWQRRVAVVAVVGALVAFVARFTATSRFIFLDNAAYFDQAAPRHLAAGTVARHIFGPLAPRDGGLSVPVAETVLLALFAATMVALYRVLVELLGPGPGPLFMTAVVGASLVSVGVVRWWPSALGSLLGALLSLACLLAYLRWFHRGVRWLLVLSVLAFVLALLVSTEAILVPLYLVALRVLLLEPWRSPREALAVAGGEWSSVWVFFAVPVVVFAAVYLNREPLSITLPPAAMVGRYLDVSWLRTFLPAVAGVRPATTNGPAVAAGVALAMAVAWTVIRRPGTGRAWVFGLVTVAAHVALFGLPSVARFGPGVGSVLSDDLGLVLLFAITVGAVFFGGRPRRRVGRFGRPSAATIPVGVLVVVLCAHVAVSWWGATRLAGELPGGAGGPFLQTVVASLGGIERRGSHPSVLDRTVPDYVAARWALFGPPFEDRLSEVLPLVDGQLTFDRLGPDLYKVADDGTLYPARFQPAAGGAAARLRQTAALTVAYGEVADRGASLCIRASSVYPAQVEFTPPEPLQGTGWYLALGYRSDAGRAVPLFVDHGTGYPLPNDRTLPTPPTADQTRLADLGDGPVARLRIDLPAGSTSCLTSLRVGRVTPSGGTDDHRGDQLVLPAPADSFDRPDNPTDLGAIAGGPAWHPITGGWGVLGGAAVVSAPVPENLAVVALARPAAIAGVTLATLREGAGLVFRYQDPDNFWYVTAAPSFATWSIGRVLDGTNEVVGNTGLSPVGDGTTVAVRTTSRLVDVALNGVIVKTVTDPTLGHAVGAGLMAGGAGAGDARFHDFAAAPVAPSGPRP
ncbi:MAG TPA: hypothetical protein VHT75_06765 [Acidimicrobiales bacterium]|nr:hypothetical protein [Acidimicrobiales bacterium]